MYYKYTTEINHTCYFSYINFKLYTDLHNQSAHKPNIYTCIVKIEKISQKPELHQMNIPQNQFCKFFNVIDMI